MSFKSTASEIYKMVIDADLSGFKRNLGILYFTELR